MTKDIMKILIGIFLYATLQTFYFEAKPNSLILPLHRRMDSVSLRKIFNVESCDEVPEYEIVHIRHLSNHRKTEMKIFHLSAFGKDIHLHLRRNDDFDKSLKKLKMFTAESSNNDIRFSEVSIKDDDLGTTYQDVNRMAAVIVRQGLNGEFQMEGTIGNDLIVKPVPNDALTSKDDAIHDGTSADESERRNSKMDCNSYTTSEKLSSTRGVPHFVFKNPVKIKDVYRVFLNDTLEMIGNNHRSKRSSSLEKVWPEVLLLVDYEIYAEHIYYNLSETEMRRYYTAFLNGVDLRFKVFSDPKISLMLAGIIISKDKNAASYLETNRLASPNESDFYGDKVLKELSQYLYSAEGLPEYDLALLLTGLDMCLEEEDNCNTNIAGLAYYQGACSVNETLSRVMKIGIVEDNGGFDGIMSATHEIGHLLGTLHDGDSQLETFNGPGAELCGFEEGFIMSHQTRNTEAMFQWSNCSIEQIKYFLNSEKATCLRNKPESDNMTGIELPGATLSLDEQCKRNWATRACANDSRVCLHLHCYYDDEECVPMLPAAEGSVCGDGQVCRDGRCI